MAHLMFHGTLSVRGSTNIKLSLTKMSEEFKYHVVKEKEKNNGKLMITHPSTFFLIISIVLAFY